jgi:hypothetical protein
VDRFLLNKRSARCSTRRSSGHVTGLTTAATILDLRYKEVFAAAKHIECLDPVDAAPDRIFRDRECAPFFLQA